MKISSSLREYSPNIVLNTSRSLMNWVSRLAVFYYLLYFCALLVENVLLFCTSVSACRLNVFTWLEKTCGNVYHNTSIQCNQNRTKPTWNDNRLPIARHMAISHDTNVRRLIVWNIISTLRQRPLCCCLRRSIPLSKFKSLFAFSEFFAAITISVLIFRLF